MEALAVGIDLGTTNSLVGAVFEGRAQIIRDATGNELLPSVVSAGAQGGVIVGRAAKNRRLLDPRGTVVSVKRTMGTDVRHRVGTRELSAPQVSALILGALLDRAEARLGARPTRAVITVPANFNDAQRQATRDAGQLAGLTVERLLNEPTAAALTYHTGAEQLVMVYDLGGGTFDVSILERAAGFLEVRASHGDTHLGGDDVDRALVQLVLERLGAKVAGKVKEDPLAMTRLVEAVERAKIALSDRAEVRLFDPFIAGEGADAVHLDVALTQGDVSDVARPFVERTLACLDAAMRDTRVRPSDLDRVLLVGGASRMPIVRSMVAAHMGRPAQLDLDADRAVGLGASILAGRLSGAVVADVLVDITPHTLSVGVVGDSLDLDIEMEGEEDLLAAPVIPRGTVVPAERHRMVRTMVDDQIGADIPIAQGERPRIGDNTRLGEVRITDLPPSPAYSPVEVTFRVDLSGVLHVSAVHLPSGKSAAVSIANSPYQLTEQRRASAMAEIGELRAAGVALGAKPDNEVLTGDSTAIGALAGEGEIASENELSLASAMLARARRAMERAGGEVSVRDRVREIADALSKAIAAKAASVSTLTDSLSDALLDMV